MQKQATPGHNPPYTASTNPPSERPPHFETCRMNEVAGHVIELKVGAGGTAAVGQQFRLTQKKSRQMPAL